MNFGLVSSFNDMGMDLFAFFDPQKPRTGLEKGGKGVIIGKKTTLVGGVVKENSFLRGSAFGEGSDDVVADERSWV